MKPLILGLVGCLAFCGYGSAQDFVLEGDAAVEFSGTAANATGPSVLHIVIEGEDTPIEVPFLDVGGEAIFEGDIILGTAEEMALLNQFVGTDFSSFEKEQAEEPTATDGARALGLRGLAIIKNFGGGARRWPNATLPYVVPPNFPNRERISKAIQLWERSTPIKFVERTADNARDYRNYVTFTAVAAGCSSSIGMMGGSQAVKLAPDCSAGNVAHEIGHALGLGHEQTRKDRDACVTIVFANIIDEFEGNYGKNPGKYQDKGPYDFDSIMHYPDRGAFNVNANTPSIILADGVRLPVGVVMGQRSHFSNGDIATIVGMYGQPSNVDLPKYC